MGFNINGMNSRSYKGEHFQANVWWWRPLWKFVAISSSDVLTDEDIENGEFNSGHKISRFKATAIANKLKKLDKAGEVVKYELSYKKRLNNLPLEECDICHGAGIRTDKIGEEIRAADPEFKCNKCNGEGEVESFEKHYLFKAKFVMKFAEFCEDSSGFEIC